MSEVPARSAAVAEAAWNYFTSRVIDDMLQAGEDCTDTPLYKRRLAEATAALRKTLDGKAGR